MFTCNLQVVHQRLANVFLVLWKRLSTTDCSLPSESSRKWLEYACWWKTVCWTKARYVAFGETLQWDPLPTGICGWRMVWGKWMDFVKLVIQSTGKTTIQTNNVFSCSKIIMIDKTSEVLTSHRLIQTDIAIHCSTMAWSKHFKGLFVWL